MSGLALEDQGAGGIGAHPGIRGFMCISDLQRWISIDGIYKDIQWVLGRVVGPEATAGRESGRWTDWTRIWAGGRYAA